MPPLTPSVCVAEPKAASQDESLKRVNILVAGRKRSFLLFSPGNRHHYKTASSQIAADQSTQPTSISTSASISSEMAPLVLVFHGSYTRGGTIMNYSRFNNVAEKQGAYVAYPDMDYRHGWELPEQFDNPEIPFVESLIEKLKQDRPIDPSRIYATGYSSGADFVQLLACHKETASKIAAFAPICSNLDRSWAEKCQREIPISIMMINGTDDEMTLWHGTKTRWMAVPKCFEFWSKQSGCEINRHESMFETAGSKCQAVLLSAENKELSSEVALLEIDGGGHTWPGSKPQNWLLRRLLGTTYLDVDANHAIWEFFAKHHKGI